MCYKYVEEWEQYTKPSGKVKERLNKSQIIQLADIAIVSNDIRDLEENLKWESYIRKHKI